MGAQAAACFRTRWPPAEAPLGQALGGQPESLAIVGQDPDRPRTAVAEDEQTAGKRIGVQFLPAELRQGIYPLASVDRLNGDQYAQLRRDLDHNTNSTNVRLKLTTSAALALSSIRILARRPSISIAHCATAVASGAINSINDGEVVFFSTPFAAIMSCLSLP